MSEYTTTPNLGLYKPDYNRDFDNWGNHLNFNADRLDQALGGSANGPFLPLSGAAPMTGPLTLAGNATGPLQAVPLQQVNSTSAGGPFLPLTGGTVNGPLTATGQVTIGGGANNAIQFLAGATSADPALMLMSSTTGGLSINGPLLLQTNGGSATQFIFTNYSPAGNTIIGDARGGTPSAPTGTGSNRQLLTLQGRGYFSGTTTPQAQFSFNAASTWSATSQGTYIDFQVTPLNSLVMASAMRLQANGQLSIGTTAAVGNYKLYVSNGDVSFASNNLFVGAFSGSTTFSVGSAGNILAIAATSVPTDQVTISAVAPGIKIASALQMTGVVGFNGTAPIAKPTVSGAKGSNAALASLLTALASYGLVTDSST